MFILPCASALPVSFQQCPISASSLMFSLHLPPPSSLSRCFHPLYFLAKWDIHSARVAFQHYPHALHKKGFILVSVQSCVDVLCYWHKVTSGVSLRGLSGSFADKCCFSADDINSHGHLKKKKENTKTVTHLVSALTLHSRVAKYKRYISNLNQWNTCGPPRPVSLVGAKNRDYKLLKLPS